MFFETTLLGSVELDVALKLFLAALSGGLIGLEREKHGRPAGLRTNLLVAVGSCVMVIVSEAFYTKYGGFDAQSALRIDPSRVAAQIVTGVGFLGAGVIIKTGAAVQGLTTAACVWIVSAIGLAIGAGQYAAGIGGFVITFVSLWLLRILETKMPRTVYKYVILTTDNSGDEKHIRAVFEDRGFTIIKMDYAVTFPAREQTFIFTVAGKHSSPISQVIDLLSGQRFVQKLEIRS